MNDFCRVVKLPKKPILRCTLATGRGVDQLYAGDTFDTPISYPAAVKGNWVNFGGDGKLAFCRAIDSGKGRGYLSCIPFAGEGFGDEIRTQNPVPLGSASGRAWIDVNGDGKTDFCTLLQTRPGYGKLSCRLSHGDSFSDNTVGSMQLHWRGPGFRSWIVNADGKASFCMVAGINNTFVDCMVSTGTEFAGPYRDLLNRK